MTRRYPSASGSGPRRRRSWWRRGLTGIGLLTVLLAGLELALWGAGKFVALGIEERPLTEDGASYTIACIGDSWTAGQPGGRYPDLLVERLNARGNAMFRAVNLGLHGTNSSQALERLGEFLDQERPDLILVMTGNNDHWNLDSSTYWRFQEGSLGAGSILMARARVSLHSLRVYKLGRMIGQKLTGARTSNEFLVRQAGNGASPTPPGAIDLETHRRQLEFNLVRFIEVARLHDVPLVFQTYFHFHGFRTNEVIRDVALAHRIPLVDNNLAFHEVPPAERDVLRIPDGHPSARGYGFIADNVVRVLEEHRLIADRR